MKKLVMFSVFAMVSALFGVFQETFAGDSNNCKVEIMDFRENGTPENVRVNFLGSRREEWDDHWIYDLKRQSVDQFTGKGVTLLRPEIEIPGRQARRIGHRETYYLELNLSLNKASFEYEDCSKKPLRIFWNCETTNFTCSVEAK